VPGHRYHLWQLSLNKFLVRTHVGLHQNFEIKSAQGTRFGFPRKVSSQLKFTAKDIIAY
jgi:hypothetical protein